MESPVAELAQTTVETSPPETLPTPANDLPWDRKQPISTAPKNRAVLVYGPDSDHGVMARLKITRKFTGGRMRWTETSLWFADPSGSRLWINPVYWSEPYNPNESVAK